MKPRPRPRRRPRRSTRLLEVLLLLAFLGTAAFVAAHLPTLQRAGGLLRDSLASGGLLGELLGYLQTALRDLKDVLLSPELVGLYVLITGGIILLENKNPDRTLAWLLVLVLLPLVGLLLYFLVGPRFVAMRWFRRCTPSASSALTELSEVQARKLAEGDAPFLPPVAPPFDRTVRLLLRNSRTPLLAHNEVTVLTDGDATFGAILGALREARHFIHLEYFAIANDGIGNEIREVLEERSRAGVAVRVVYDGVGSWKLGKDYLDSLQEAGVEAHPFLPASFPMFRREFNYRNHRKILVVDGHTGFVGGLNIGDMYLGRNPEMGHWRDTHLRLRGEGVSKLQEIFLRDWRFCTRKPLEGADLFPCVEEVYPEKPLQIATSGPDSIWEAILQGYFSLISGARRRIWITTPYLVPSPDLIGALKVAALSGLDVRIIIPGKADHKMVYWASRGNLDDLLGAGIRVYSYQNGFIHSKIVLVDGEVASVGTANMDLRSLEINYEVQAFLYDRGVTERLEADFVQDLAHSREFTLEERRCRPLKERFLESLCRLLSPQL